MGPVAIDVALRGVSSEPPGYLSPAESSESTESFDSHLAREPDAHSVAPHRETSESRSPDDDELDDKEELVTPDSPPNGSTVQPIEDVKGQKTEQDDDESVVTVDAESKDDEERSTKLAVKRQLTEAIPDELPVAADVEAVSEDTVAPDDPSAIATRVDAPVDPPEPQSEISTDALVENQSTEEIPKTEGESSRKAATAETAAPTEVRPAESAETVAEIPVAATNLADVVQREPTTAKAKGDLKRASQKTEEVPATEANQAANPLSAVAAVAVTAADGVASSTEKRPRLAAQRSTSTATSAVTKADPASEAATASSQSRLAQHLVTSSDGRLDKEHSLSGADQNRFVDRVARAFHAAENRQGVVKLRLHPPELGSLRIELRMQNGTMTARMEAETVVAQSLLLEHANALRDRLADQGIRVERFDVDLSERRSMDQPGGSGQQESRDRAPSSTGREERPLLKPDTDLVRAPKSLAAPGQLNVIV